MLTVQVLVCNVHVLSFVTFYFAESYKAGMEDLYAVLQCSTESTADQLKQKYRELAKIHHPDSHPLDNSVDHHAYFVKINHAYKILSDSALRQAYDACWHQKQFYQELPIQEMVDLEELEFDSDAEQYSLPCRCGDSYTMSSVYVLLHFEYAACPSCSLCIKIVYSSVDSEDSSSVQRPG